MTYSVIIVFISFLGNIVAEWIIRFLSTKYSVILSKSMQHYRFISRVISVKFEQRWLFQLGKDASEVVALSTKASNIWKNSPASSKEEDIEKKWTDDYIPIFRSYSAGCF